MSQHTPGCKGDEIAELMIRERGYLVVGIPEGGMRLETGDKLGTWAHMPLSRPIVIIGKATAREWREQSKFLSPKYLNDRAVPRSKAPPGKHKYYRAKAEGNS